MLWLKHDQGGLKDSIPEIGEWLESVEFEVLCESGFLQEDNTYGCVSWTQNRRLH